MCVPAALLWDGLTLPPHFGGVLSRENSIFYTAGSSVFDPQVSAHTPEQEGAGRSVCPGYAAGPASRHPVVALVVGQMKQKTFSCLGITALCLIHK